MDKLTELFCLVDNFCQVFEPEWNKHLLETGHKRRDKKTQLSLSEMMTIVILFHQLRFRHFKVFYQDYVLMYLRPHFPHLLSYNRFVELMPRCLVGLTAFFETLKGECTGISFVDSTPLKVCHNRRIPRHKTFVDYAARGKNSIDWFYGFKLHLLINHQGELVCFKLTSGNVNDRHPLKAFCQKLHGLLFGDKGYLGQAITEQLADMGVKLITPVRKNMKEKMHTAFEKCLLQRRGIIETVNHELKNLCQIEHTRHRSLNNFLVNLMAGIVAYCLQPKKPAVKGLKKNQTLLKTVKSIA